MKKIFLLLFVSISLLGQSKQSTKPKYEAGSFEQFLETGTIDKEVIENAVKKAYSNPKLKRQIKQTAGAVSGENQYYSLKDCIHCDGNGTMKICVFCSGKGNIYCRYCSGRKYTKDGNVCLECNGKGLVLCSYCQGKRYNIKCSHQILISN